MKKKNFKLKVATLSLMIASQFALSSAVFAEGRGNDKPIGTIYVTGQGLYYDTFRTADLPFKGKFQQLDPNAAMGPSTEFGPGDNGYVGGRWWIDTNLDGEMDDMDVYFSCPLLGPGRLSP